MERKTITIDATNQSLGRLATKVADLLRGKKKTDFLSHVDGGDFVVVKNMRKIRITGRKLEQKKYRHHTGFPGGLREKPMKEIFLQHPEELLKKAVWGMLPTNKLRSLAIKRLQFEK